VASPVWLRLLIAVCALQAPAAIAVAEILPTAEARPTAVSASTTWQLELPTQLNSLLDKTSGLEPAAGDIPAASDSDSCSTLLYLRVSRDYLSKRFEKDVDRTKPVTDQILGTRIRGESLTRGKTRMVLIPSDDQFVAEIEFIGTVDSRTRGTNGPAILHYKSESTFRATKRITIDADGLTVAPARADAKTKLRPLRIESRTGGLVGMVVERVARRRVAESQHQANAIASDHTADIVAGDLDRGLEKSVGVLKAALAEAAGLKPSELAQLTTCGSGQRMVLKLRTTRDHAELVLAPEEVTWQELASILPAIDGTPHVALRVHRAILTSTGDDSVSSPALAKLLAHGMKTQLAKRTAAVVESPAAADAHPIEWSIGINWLCVDVCRPAANTSVADEPAPRSAQLVAETPHLTSDGAQ
jgi:hypothetical protein